MSIKAPESVVNRLVYMQGEKTAEIWIYDTIGPAWAGLVNAKGIVESIADLNVDQISVRINSQGGSVFEAMAIYNALARHSASIRVSIDGVALSAASYVAMAGDEIEMAENGLFMIHEAVTYAGGKASELRSTATMLEQVNMSATKLYADRSGRSETEVKTMLSEETWMGATEAKAKGFVTKIVPNKQVSAKVDLTHYSNVPDWAREALANLIQEPQMSTSTTPPVTPPTQPAPQQTATTPPPIAPVVVAPATSPAMTAEQISALVNTAVMAARQRDLDIQAVCNRAGVPSMAAEFIRDPKMDLQTVQDKIITVLCAKNPPAGLVGGNPGDQGTAPSPDQKYKDEFKSNEPYLKANGITEETWIKTRKQQDGMA